MRLTTWIYSLALLLCLALLVSPVNAGETSPADELAAKRKTLAEEIEKLTKADKAEGAGDETDVSATEEELELLQTLDAIFVQQQTRLEQKKEAELEKKKGAESLQTVKKFGPTEAKPYSFLLLENLRDERSAEKDRFKAIESDIVSLEALLETAKEHFDECESDRRAAHEAASENDDKKKAAELAQAVTMAKHASDIAREAVTLRRQEVELATLRRDVCKLTREELDEKISVICKGVQFTSKDLSARKKEIKRYHDELAKRLKDERARMVQIDADQVLAMKKLTDAKATPDIIELATDALHVVRNSQQTVLTLINERLQETAHFDHYWTCRYKVENGTAKPDDIEEWHDGLDKFVDQLDSASRSLEHRIAAIRIDQATLFRRAHDDEGDEVRKWIDLQSDALHHLHETCESGLVDLSSAQRWTDRFLTEMSEKLHPAGTETVWTKAKAMGEEVWDYEIASVGDTPITIGKIVKLLGYLLVSYLGARFLSRLVGRSILPRFGLNEGAASAVQTILFYTLFLSFGALSFEIVHLPFAAFTFLGGAAAIAIGFGSQDIANNFMSGIILLAEQPIRVGDVVKIDGTLATVDHIGPRSTRLKTDSNHELIVPNSKLLDESVVNMTLSDSLVQTAIKVTLSPPMPVAYAKRLLTQAAASHSDVLKSPEPVALFLEFSSSSMDFELHYWIQLNSEMQAAIVQSDIRETISRLFSETESQPTSIGRVALPGEGFGKVA
jgi:small-conductance mechanosensitive channel